MIKSDQQNLDRSEILQKAFCDWNECTKKIQRRHHIASWKLIQALAQSPYSFYIPSQSKWHDVRLLYAVRVWRCRTIFQKNKNVPQYEWNVKPFLEKRYNFFFTKWLDWWKKKQLATVKKNETIWKRYFRCWKEHFLYLKALPQQLEYAALYCHTFILRKALLPWKKICETKGKYMRMAKKCFLHWKIFHMNYKEAESLTKKVKTPSSKKKIRKDRYPHRFARRNVSQGTKENNRDLTQMDQEFFNQKDNFCNLEAAILSHENKTTLARQLSLEYIKECKSVLPQSGQCDIAVALIHDNQSNNKISNEDYQKSLEQMFTPERVLVKRQERWNVAKEHFYRQEYTSR